MADTPAADEQMELLDESMLPVRPDVEELVRQRSFLGGKKLLSHSGKIVLRRVLACEELAEGVCTALLMGLSVRLIAKRFGMSTRSVINIRQAMTDRGELAPLRQRIAQKLDRVIELGLERWEEGIVSGEIHPGQLPIPTLAALDKKAAMDSGLVGDTGRSEAEILLAQVKAVQGLYAMASDTESAGSNADVVDVESTTQAPDCPATGQATVAAGVPASLPAPTLPQPPATSPSAPGLESGGRAGGSTSAATPATPIH